MPVLFTYLFKINIALLLFCLGYYAVLRHLTFYTLNRIYLVAAIVFSSIYPWIDLSGFVQRHQQLTGPVQHVILQWSAPAENLVQPFNQHNYWYWIEWVFWVGAILFAIRLLIQLFSLYKLYRDSQPGHVHNYPVRLVEGDVSPFSFWRSIYVNPAKLSPYDLEKVLEHEHVHVSEWHTLDILLAELSTVFYWFNPGVWLMKKAVRENIEFITDRKILQKGTDSKQYQYSLLNVSMAGSHNKLVNNFNISTIKKRIIMMNAKRSSRASLGRYIFVAPAIVALLLVFSISKADEAKRALHNFRLSLAGNAPVSSTGEKPIPTLPVVKKTKGKIGLAKNVAHDTIYAAKSKDGKKNMLITSDKSLDSVGFVINGAKATRDEAIALDPSKVLSLDMMSAGDAKQFVDFTLEKSDYLFITTSDSERGKYLKQRIDKSTHYGNLAGSSTNQGAKTNVSRSGKVSTSYSTVNVATGSTDVAPATANVNYSVATTSASSSDSAPVTASGMSDNQTKATADVVIVGSPRVSSVRVNGADVTITDPRTEVITIDSAGRRHVNYIYRGKNVVYANSPNNDQITIDNFHNGVLYMVDGKEVKNLKGVSAEDIQSITVLKDEAARKQYGDKAKNGVIVIKTKKISE